MAITDIRHLGEQSYSVLSGGEKQRVQLARALAQTFGLAGDPESKYLLLDETNRRARHCTSTRRIKCSTSTMSGT